MHSMSSKIWSQVGAHFPFRAHTHPIGPQFLNHTNHHPHPTRAIFVHGSHFRTRSLDSVNGHFVTMSMTRTAQRPAATQVLQHADEKSGDHGAQRGRGLAAALSTS